MNPRFCCAYLKLTSGLFGGSASGVSSSVMVCWEYGHLPPVFGFAEESDFVFFWVRNRKINSTNFHVMLRIFPFYQNRFICRARSVECTLQGEIKFTGLLCFLFFSCPVSAADETRLSMKVSLTGLSMAARNEYWLVIKGTKMVIQLYDPVTVLVCVTDLLFCAFRRLIKWM